jgi:MSHA pilin protein MshD
VTQASFTHNNAGLAIVATLISTLKNLSDHFQIRGKNGFSPTGIIVKQTKIHIQSGVTLIELILSMVIISIALVGIFSVINVTVNRSADPVLRNQAIAIAEAYLEEIQLQSYADPNGTNVGEDRTSFDNVNDYNGLNNTGAYSQQGILISSLSGYNVSVTVADQVVSGLTAKKITVTVTDPGSSSLTLVGYRFNY